MSLLTELDSFALPVLQRCQSYGLRRLRALRALRTKKSNRRYGKNWVVFHKKWEALFPSFPLFLGRSQQSNINKSLTEKSSCQT
jgi:hypothetical protein